MSNLVKNERGYNVVTSEDLSLRDVVTPLFRRRKVMIVTFLGVFATVILLALLRGPSYTSRLTILVNRERFEPLVTPASTSQSASSDNPITEEEINSEVGLLTSRDVLEKVVVANGLDHPSKQWSLGKLLHPNLTEEERVARAVKGLAHGIKAEAVTKTSLIEVKFSSSDPQLAYGVLNSLGEFYTQKNVSVHRPVGSFKFFTDQTQRYQDGLQQAEAKLRDLSSRSGIADPEAQETNIALQVASSTGLLHLAQQNLAADQERIKNDLHEMKSMPKRATTVQTSAGAAALLDQLRSTLVSEEKKRTQLLQNYDVNYPPVQDLDLQIAQSRAAVEAAEKTRYVTESTDLDPTFEAVREDLAKTRADRAGQSATLAATGKSIKQMQAQLVSLDRQAILRQDLTREVKADEQNYLTYMAKREQERTSDALDNSKIANVAIAVPAAIPVLPAVGWPMIGLTSFGLALFAGIGMAYASDILDSSFRTPRQLAQIGIPVVIVFPKRLA